MKIKPTSRGRAAHLTLQAEAGYSGPPWASVPTAARLRTWNPNTFNGLKIRSWTAAGPLNGRRQSPQRSFIGSPPPLLAISPSCPAAAILIPLSVSCVDQNANQAGLQALNRTSDAPEPVVTMAAKPPSVKRCKIGTIFVTLMS